MNAMYDCATERMVMPNDRRMFNRDRAKLVYIVINPWDYTCANVIGVFYKESDAIACVSELKANGDDSGNECPNVFYECSIIE